MLSKVAQMSTAMMSAPSWASRIAWLRPWPRAAPVMKATLPSMRPAMACAPVLRLPGVPGRDGAARSVLLGGGRGRSAAGGRGGHALGYGARRQPALARGEGGGDPLPALVDALARVALEP